MPPAKRKNSRQIVFKVRFGAIAFIACRSFREVSPVFFETESAAKNMVPGYRRSLPAINAKLSFVCLPHDNFSKLTGSVGGVK
jgi:hypothetical protein